MLMKKIMILFSCRTCHPWISNLPHTKIISGNQQYFITDHCFRIYKPPSPPKLTCLISWQAYVEWWAGVKIHTWKWETVVLMACEPFCISCDFSFHLLCLLMGIPIRTPMRTLIISYQVIYRISQKWAHFIFFHLSFLKSPIFLEGMFSGLEDLWSLLPSISEVLGDAWESALRACLRFLS